MFYKFLNFTHFHLIYKMDFFLFIKNMVICLPVFLG